VGWVPVLGLASIAISGGIGLLKLPAEWIAVKEAMIPAILALAILVSAWIGRPLARIFLDAIIDKDKIYPILEAQGKMDDYERRTSVATWLLAFTFILSATLNFILAKVVVTADGGTQLYTEQIGRMTALSFPVITVPVFITLTATIFYIMSTLSKLTGLEMDEVLKDQRKQKSEP
jgi:heme/copper-type cytochrome/quinol oxidase subunit 2